MAETNDHFFVLDALADVGLGCIGVVIAALNDERRFVGAAVLRPLSAPIAPPMASTGRNRARDDACGEGRSVELVFGIQHERDVHRPRPFFGRRLAVQQMQEMFADRVVIGLDRDAPARASVVIQYSSIDPNEARSRSAASRAQPRYDRAFGKRRRQRRTPACKTSIGCAARDLFEYVAHDEGQAAERFQLRLVVRQLGSRRQLSVQDEIGDLFELGMRRQVANVVAAIPQIIAMPDGADRGVPGDNARERDRSLGLRIGGHEVLSL